MGIKYLNKFINRNCNKGIDLIDLKYLANRKIAIDISIYMYNFKINGGLIEYMYKMIFIFREYNIIPVFIFDGKPPAEKQKILYDRREKKREAARAIIQLRNKCNTLNDNSSEYKNIHSQITNLKKRTTSISYWDIVNVKKLLKLTGVTYYDSEGEADTLCAKLVIKNIVWGCISDDMDLFIYGCPRVIRQLNIFNNTAVLYNTKEILKELNMTANIFKEICVVSGTDYNYNDNSNIYTTLKYYNNYVYNNKKKNQNFYQWLENNTNYIEDYYKLCTSYIMFDVSNINIDKYKNIKIYNGPYNKDSLCEFLKDYNFVFV
tara:strand:- start:1831 stop:2787 length:957 start_codon:yes stop_codon:yes gene_type:complete